MGKRPLEMVSDGEAADASVDEAEDEEPRSPSTNLPRRLGDAIAFGSQSHSGYPSAVKSSPTEAHRQKRQRPSASEIIVEEVRHVGNAAILRTPSGSPSHLARRPFDNNLLPLGADEAWHCAEGDDMAEDERKSDPAEDLDDEPAM